MKSAVLFVVLTLCVFTNGFAQRRAPSSRQVSTKPGAETIPTIQTQTAKVLKSPTWDYMIWTDASEKKHLRAKLLTANEATVHLANLDGTTVTIPVSRFSKADRELIDRYTAKENAILSTDADHDELAEAIKTATTVPDDTTIRRTAESEKRQAAFLKQYNGKPFVLCFPIEDISHQRERNGGIGAPRRPVLSDGYELRLGAETNYDNYEGPSRGAEPCQSAFGGSARTALVRLTPSQAAWVNKGDKLIVKGTADFTFKENNERWLYFWRRGLTLRLKNVSLSLTRDEPDTTLADAVAARVAQFKAVQAAEAAEAAKKAAEDAEKEARQTDPFK